MLSPECRRTTSLIPAGMIGPEPVMGVLSHVKESHRSGLDQLGLTQGIGDIKHKVEGSAQELC